MGLDTIRSSLPHPSSERILQAKSTFPSSSPRHSPGLLASLADISNKACEDRSDLFQGTSSLASSQLVQAPSTEGIDTTELARLHKLASTLDSSAFGFDYGFTANVFRDPDNPGRVIKAIRSTFFMRQDGSIPECPDPVPREVEAFNAYYFKNHTQRPVKIDNEVPPPELARQPCAIEGEISSFFDVAKYVGSLGGFFFISMPEVPGRTLHAIINQGEISKRIPSALDCMYERLCESGFSHGDLHLRNILFDGKFCHPIDFGFCCSSNILPPGMDGNFDAIYLVKRQFEGMLNPAKPAWPDLTNSKFTHPNQINHREHLALAQLARDEAFGN